MDRWSIEFYSSLSQKPVEEFIGKLEPRAKAKVFNTFELLSEFGPLLKMPHSKKLTGTPLWELRILGENSLRFFYVAFVGKSFLVLHGFTKKTQKTPPNELKIALNRLKTYK